MSFEGIKPHIIGNQEEDLIALTEEMKTAMAQAREKEELEKIRLLKIYEPISNDIPNNFRDYDQAQIFFITVSKNGFIEETHPVVIIDAIIERLDLNCLYKTYSDEGNKAYHPKMMLKILFYAYYCRIMTSRTIWRNVISRCDFLYLAAGQVPNFRTINAFRLRHLNDLPNIFAQIVMMCKEMDMIGFDHLAIDGEKIQANANFKNSKNLSQVKKELERYEKGLKKILEQEVNETIDEETIEKRVDTLEKKISKLNDLQKQLEEIGDEKKRINTTDPEAPVMRHKDSRSRPSYNHQTARDEKYGVVTAVETQISGDKPEDLMDMVDQSVENTGEHHKNVTADCGFQSYENLEKMEERSEEFYVPDKRFESAKNEEGENKKFSQEQFKKNDDGTYLCPGGRVMEKEGTIKTGDGGTAIIFKCKDCTNCVLKDKCTKAEVRTIVIDEREELREKMREKLKSDDGREIYMKRQGLIEPIHGDDQKNSGWIQHLLRGYEKAKGEFVLIRIVQNLRCMVKHRGNEILAYA